MLAVGKELIAGASAAARNGSDGSAFATTGEGSDDGACDCAHSGANGGLLAASFACFLIYAAFNWIAGAAIFEAGQPHFERASTLDAAGILGMGEKNGNSRARGHDYVAMRNQRRVKRCAKNLSSRVAARIDGIDHADRDMFTGGDGHALSYDGRRLLGGLGGWLRSGRRKRHGRRGTGRR